MPYYAQTKNHTMNQEFKKISVVMCTFNGAKYLAEQLDSILAQSYSNIEIIVVDDCSTDNTFEILKNYQPKDSRIQVFQNSKNLGFVQNFSKAISLATGDYIALADQDDIWKPYKLEKFANDIQNHLLIYSDAVLIAPDGQSLNRELTRPNDHLVSGHCNQAFLFKNCVSGNTLMFKRELLQYILPIPNVSFHDIWIAFIASSLGTIAYTEEALVYYRRHESQVTNTQKEKKKGLSCLLQTPKRKIEKSRQKTNEIQRILNDFLAYRAFVEKVNDQTLLSILNPLINHYRNYNNIFINYSLRKILIKHRENLFAICPSNKRLRYAKKNSRGQKFNIIAKLFK